MTCNQNLDKYSELIKSSNVSIQEKMNIIFTLKELGTNDAVYTLHNCITNNSVLLDHEIAYILGQLKNDISIPFLINLAKNIKYDPIVRHEAIEALGNFEDINIIKHLELFLTNNNDLIRESAILAIYKLNQLSYNNGISKISIFGSRDPTYPANESNLNNLKHMFIYGTLIEKYQAMFKLRDINTQESIDILNMGFSDNSALLRHEVAYVLGQAKNSHAINALKLVLENESEEDVVRHEAAEALGAIGTSDCYDILMKFKNTNIQIIKESIEVGLSMLSNIN
ncbi:hypothetical protein EBI_25956 [Enterocytozoon bieneusi H348]|nr:hypothetical protein EBI_25956 [Enterocytozoon bieneusi H348]|eukprot:XP_002650177.1 hypothetical protein EBI_25956 [Enterocytozoon bieneusi H348]